MQDTIDREYLAERLATAIREYIHGEGGLVRYAREIHNGDEDVPLAEETPDSVGNVLWSETSAGDMAHAARTCGSITAYFDLARWLEVELPEETKKLEPWGDAIYPL